MASFLTSRLLKNRLLRPIFVMCAARTRSMDRIRRCAHAIGGYFASFSTLQADSSYRQKFWDADKVVCGSGQHEEPVHQAAATMPGLAQTPDRLDPSERFFDLFALDGADPVTGMAGCARIDRRAAVGVVLRDVRRAAALPAAGDEVGRVIVLVAANRAAGPGIVLDHVECRGALGRAIGFGHPSIDEESIAVLHHQMAHVTQLGLLARSLAEQPGIGVGGRGMRVVLALLAMEVALGIARPAGATLARGWTAAILRHEALHAGPRLDQGAIDREVLARQQLADLWQVEHGNEKLGGDIALE